MTSNVAKPGNQARIVAALALLLGACTLAGWTLGIPALLQLRPGWTPMVVNTGIGFVLSGLGLGVASSGGGRWRRFATLLGVLVALLALEELAVLAFDISPALSLPDLHRPLQPDYPHPGRMAPNTAFCFLLFGTALAGISQSRTGRMARWAQWAAVAVIGIGVLGATGYALQLEFLYGWGGVVRMAAHTALGMIALGIGLAAHARSVAPPARADEDRRVSAVFSTAASLLLFGAAGSGLLGFGFLQSAVEEQARDYLAQMSRDHIAMFDTVIAYRSARADVLASSLQLADPLRDDAAIPAAGTADGALHAWAVDAAAHGFSFVGIDIDGHVRDLSGHVATPTLAIDLRGLEGSSLLWDDGFVLRRRQPLQDAAGAHGRLVTEQRLDSLTRLSRQTNALGETTEMAVCNGDAARIHCFPLRSHALPFSALRIVAGHPLPMDRALRGHVGTVIALDYRGRRVLAGLGPIGRTGLGLVVKREIVEIYAPIRRRLEEVLLFLAVFVAAGLWIMRRQLLPLLSALEASRTRASADLARLDAAVESHLDAFFIMDCVRDADGAINDMRYSMMNSTAEQVLGRPRSETLGKGMCEMFPVLREDGFLAACIGVVETGEHRILERASVVRGMHWYHMQLVKLGDGVGLTVRDITSAHHAAEVIRHQALHDPLTGAVNRAGFELTLKAVLEEARAAGTVAGVAMLDLDNFKRVNDRLGHAAGDQLLVEVARRLKAAVRPSDTVARLGGDEFVVVLRNLEPGHGADVVAAKLVAQVGRPMRLDDQDYEVTISLGISRFPLDGAAPEALLRAADAAMYRAKAAGRNRFESASRLG